MLLLIFVGLLLIFEGWKIALSAPSKFVDGGDAKVTDLSVLSVTYRLSRSDVIRSMNFDGSDVYTVIKQHQWLSHPFSIALYGHHLFWTDWRTTMIVSSNKWTGANVTVVELSVVQPFDIKVYHESRQPGNVCFLIRIKLWDCSVFGVIVSH